MVQIGPHVAPRAGQAQRLVLANCICLLGAALGLLLWFRQPPFHHHDLLRSSPAMPPTAAPPSFPKVTKPTDPIPEQTPVLPNEQTYEKPSKRYPKTQFTLTNFPVAGVNLADYAFNDTVTVDPSAPPFELFEDFDISHLIQGNEGWWDLVAHRQKLERPSVSFYGDKVAQKRWMKALGIPQPCNFVLKYKSELTKSGEKDAEQIAISKLIPRRTNYVAKPTHRSGASGVWVVKYDEERGKNVVGYGGDAIEDQYDKSAIVVRLVGDLHRPAGDHESWALRHVEPGLMMEERFTEYFSDDRAATEFKVFLIWGRVWVVNWKRGLYRQGLVHRNGTLLEGKDKHQDALPDWVDWDRIVKLSEDLGANKDLFRVDIFAGVAAGSPSLKEGTTKEEQVAAVRYVVSETAFHPTTNFDDEEIFDEGARLWIAGYEMGNYRLIPNTQVPAAYKKKHMLSEQDAEQIGSARLLAQSSSSVIFQTSSI